MTTIEENNSNPTQKQCSNTKFDMRQKRFKVKEEKKKVKEREKKLIKTKTLIITYN
jgi:hypothetical protein